MPFHVQELSFQLIDELRPLIPRIRARDRALADQLMRAASSVALNISEGRTLDPGNQRARYFTASGSADESRAALRVAVGWRHIQASEAEVANRMLDSIVAILWKLTRR
jgi:four helix bundle protein